MRCSCYLSDVSKALTICTSKVSVHTPDADMRQHAVQTMPQLSPPPEARQAAFQLPVKPAAVVEPPPMPAVIRPQQTTQPPPSPPPPPPTPQRAVINNPPVPPPPQSVLTLPPPVVPQQAQQAPGKTSLGPIKMVDASHYAIGVVAYNRPDMLEKSLESLLRVRGVTAQMVTVYQDGNLASVKAVAEKHGVRCLQEIGRPNRRTLQVDLPAHV